MMLRKSSTAILQRSARDIVGCPLFHPSRPLPPNERAVTRRKASNGGSDLKEKISNLFERTSTRALEVAKVQTGRTFETLDVQRKKAFEVLSSHAQKASETLAAEAQTAFDKGATSAKEVIKKTSQQATEKIHSTVSDASTAMSQTSNAAMQATTERIQRSTVGVVSQARSVGIKAIRWAALWSLAAIFVYGVATSIPAALIRHVFSGKEDDTSTKEPSGEQSSSNSRKRWFA